MGSKPENAWKARLVKAWRGMGMQVLSLHGHAMQEPGWPDIYVAGPHGRSFWVELKYDADGVLSARQELKLKALRRYRQRIFVATMYPADRVEVVQYMLSPDGAAYDVVQTFDARVKGLNSALLDRMLGP